MTQTPPSGQGAPPRSEFGSVTAPQHPGISRDKGSADWSPSTPQQPAQQSSAQAPVQSSQRSATNGRSVPAAPFDNRSTTTVPPYSPPGGATQGTFSAASGAGHAPAGAPTVPPAAAPSGRGSRAARARGPRRARLQLRHINPWTVLKFSCVLSIALFFVWLIVIGILFGVLDAAGVVSKINDAYIQVNPGANAPIRAGIVFGGAAIIGAVNIVLFIALSTIGAVVYNLCADLVGGIEITLSER